MTDPTRIARTYFTAWEGRDFDTLRDLLADDVTFDGPLASLDNAQDCVAGLRGMSEILAGIEIVKVAADAGNVVTWFTLHTTVAPPTPTVNWQNIIDGKIREIRVFFDPRAILAG